MNMLTSLYLAENKNIYDLDSEDTCSSVRVGEQTMEENIMETGAEIMDENTMAAEEQIMDENTMVVEEKTKANEKADTRLPEITGREPHVLLVNRGQYNLCMQICVDKASMKMEGCKMYLADAETGHVFISDSSEVCLSKSKIMSATDHKVMNVISDFMVNFTEDDKKKAFDRARKYLEVADVMTDTSSSRSIQNILWDVIEYSKQEAEREINDMELDESRYQFKWDKEAGTVAVTANHFQKVLDTVEAGCTKTIFCKKLRLLEQHYDKKFIITNRNGSGYGFNDTNNKRYYKFDINNICSEMREYDNE